jgi:hypothetical protein
VRYYLARVQLRHQRNVCSHRKAHSTKRKKSDSMERPSVLFLFLGLLAGCGSATPAAGTADVPPIAESEFDAAFAKAFCDSLQTCCAKSSIPFDWNACNAAKVQAAQRIPKGDTPTYNGVAAGRCVASIRSLSVTCTASDPYNDALAATCLAIYKGTGTGGAACSVDTDCASSENLFCDHVAVAAAGVGGGVCAVRPSEHVGDICGQAGSCSNGLTCSGQRGCQPVLSLGAACVVDYVEPCGPSLVCDSGLMTCISKTALGDSCDGNNICASGTCYQQVCVESIPLATAESCSTP